VSVCSWFTNLLIWALTRGTIAGQLSEGLMTPAGARATIMVVGSFWVWAVYFVHDSTTSIGGWPGFFVNNGLRFLVMVVHLGHMAGAVSVLLMYREWAPSQTLIFEATAPPSTEPKSVSAVEASSPASITDQKEHAGAPVAGRPKTS